MTTPRRRRPRRAARCLDCRSALITPVELTTGTCDACQPDAAEARHLARGFTHPADTD